MQQHTHESKNAAQNFDACLQQARQAALDQGRPWMLNAGTVDGVFTIFSLPNVPDPTTEAPRYHSKEIRPGGFNYLFYSNPRVDVIIEEAQRTLDREKRVRLLQEYQDILARDVPMIPLYVLSGVDVWNKRFAGFQVSEWGGASLTFLDKVWKKGE